MYLLASDAVSSLDGVLLGYRDCVRGQPIEESLAVIEKMEAKLTASLSAFVILPLATCSLSC